VNRIGATIFSHIADRVGVEVDAWLGSGADAAIIPDEASDVHVLVEMVVTFDVELETHSADEIRHGQAESAPAKFGVTREIDAEIRRHDPLRTRGTGRANDRGYRQKNAALCCHRQSPIWLLAVLEACNRDALKFVLGRRRHRCRRLAGSPKPPRVASGSEPRG
jgi:hypothetical protein